MVIGSVVEITLDFTKREAAFAVDGKHRGTFTALDTSKPLGLTVIMFDRGAQVELLETVQLASLDAAHGSTRLGLLDRLEEPFDSPFQWRLEPCDAKLVNRRVQLGGCMVRNLATQTVVQTNDRHTELCAVDKRTRAASFLLEWQNNAQNEIALFSQATRRYLSVSEDAAVTTWANVSALFTTADIKPVSAKARWQVRRAPRTHVQLVAQLFVAHCSRCSRRHCAGCRSALHDTAHSPPCKPCLYLYQQLAERDSSALAKTDPFVLAQRQLLHCVIVCTGAARSVADIILQYCRDYVCGEWLVSLQRHQSVPQYGQGVRKLGSLPELPKLP